VEEGPKAEKKQISLIINRTVSSFSVFYTYDVCFPMNVASRMMSRHH